MVQIRAFVDGANGFLVFDLNVASSPPEAYTPYSKMADKMIILLS